MVWAASIVVIERTPPGAIVNLGFVEDGEPLLGREALSPEGPWLAATYDGRNVILSDRERVAEHSIDALVARLRTRIVSISAVSMTDIAAIADTAGFGAIGRRVAHAGAARFAALGNVLTVRAADHRATRHLSVAQGTITLDDGTPLPEEQGIDLTDEHAAWTLLERLTGLDEAALQRASFQPLRAPAHLDRIDG